MCWPPLPFLLILSLPPSTTNSLTLSFFSSVRAGLHSFLCLSDNSLVPPFVHSTDCKPRSCYYAPFHKPKKPSGVEILLSPRQPKQTPEIPASPVYQQQNAFRYPRLCSVCCHCSELSSSQAGCCHGQCRRHGWSRRHGYCQAWQQPGPEPGSISRYEGSCAQRQ